MATQAKSNSRSTGFGAQDLVERVVDVARQAGHSYLDATERAAENVAKLQASAGEASRIEPISAVTGAQADVTRGVADAYVSAGRRIIG
jgi:hypothetical protein